MRKTVEETPNALLDEEASELFGAGRYERAAGRETHRSGHYTRRLVTGVGEIEVSVPKLRGATAKTVRGGFAETLAYTEFPPEHWRRIRTNNGIERINREIREKDEGRRDLPERQFGPHAGDGEAEVHSGARVGQEEVLGHVEAGGDGRTEGERRRARRGRGRGQQNQFAKES